MYPMEKRPYLLINFKGRSWDPSEIVPAVSHHRWSHYLWAQGQLSQTASTVPGAAVNANAARAGATEVSEVGKPGERRATREKCRQTAAAPCLGCVLGEVRHGPVPAAAVVGQSDRKRPAAKRQQPFNSLQCHSPTYSQNYTSAKKTLEVAFYTGKKKLSFIPQGCKSPKAHIQTDVPNLINTQESGGWYP